MYHIGCPESALLRDRPMNSTFLNQLTEEIRKVPQKVTLVAVTKGIDIDETNGVIKAGVNAIGENRVEEFEKKVPHLLPVEKHFIGQIQSRKIKQIVELFDVIQSVASIEHLQRIEKEAQTQHKNIRVMLQFNISEEEQKGGFGRTDIAYIIETLPAIQSAKIIGVMGMATNTQDTEIVRKQFRLLKNIRDQLRTKFPEIVELSMGMSNDYKIALEEGATILRIGRLLFSVTMET